jgi:hypothetical protein
VQENGRRLRSASGKRTSALNFERENSGHGTNGAQQNDAQTKNRKVNQIGTCADTEDLKREPNTKRTAALGVGGDRAEDGRRKFGQRALRAEKTNTGEIQREKNKTDPDPVEKEGFSYNSDLAIPKQKRENK